MVFEQCAVRQLDDAALLADPVLAAHDPALDSVVNVNTPEDYAAARDREPPVIAVATAGPLRTVRAATVGAVADAVCRALDTAVLDGERVTDARTPVVAGDTITFRT
jgi:molybdopterin-guanine dinucleotide biosynthesis protein A